MKLVKAKQKDEELKTLKNQEGALEILRNRLSKRSQAVTDMQKRWTF